jgi:uncharacterized protein (DUF1499 family)
MEKVQHIQIKLVNPVMLLLLALFAAQVSLAAELNDGLQEGKLKPCPDSPNCISSEQGMIEPVVFSKGDAQLAWIKLQQVIVSQGGQIESLQSDYLRALFSTSWMGLKDDVEARLDVPMHRIQLRSALRVGYYDFGANRKRLNNIVRLMRMSLDPEALKNIYQ